MSAVATQIKVAKRERGRILKHLDEVPNLELEMVDAEVGDYFLANGVVVERQSATDFILGVVDRSLVEKVGKLKANHERVVFVVEGDYYEARFHQKPLDVHMALSFLSLVQGVPVLWSRDVESSAMLIYCLAVDAQHNLDRTVETRVQSPVARREKLTYLMAGLPGIDSDKAEALLKHFRTPRAVFNADAAALAQVDGIDEQTAERLANLFDTEW